MGGLKSRGPLYGNHPRTAEEIEAILANIYRLKFGITLSQNIFL